jgi:hypothetical protein
MAARRARRGSARSKSGGGPDERRTLHRPAPARLARRRRRAALRGARWRCVACRGAEWRCVQLHANRDGRARSASVPPQPGRQLPAPAPARACCVFALGKSGTQQRPQRVRRRCGWPARRRARQREVAKAEATFAHS